MRISLTFLILTRFSVFWQRAANADKEKMRMKIAQPYAAITLLVKEIAQLCANITFSGDSLTFLYNPWDHRWWIIMFLHIREHHAALGLPLRVLKNKKNNFNKYCCYRILESGEGSAADTLQFSPTPSPPTLHWGVSHKGAWRVHPHLHQHRRHHHHTSWDHCTTSVLVKFSLLYAKFI